MPACLPYIDKAQGEFRYELGLGGETTLQTIKEAADTQTQLATATESKVWPVISAESDMMALCDAFSDARVSLSSGR